MWLNLSFLMIMCLLGLATCSELTFELPDNQKQCYYEDIKQGTKSTVEYQVIVFNLSDFLFSKKLGSCNKNSLV